MGPGNPHRGRQGGRTEPEADATDDEDGGGERPSRRDARTDGGEDSGTDGEDSGTGSDDSGTGGGDEMPDGRMAGSDGMPSGGMGERPAGDRGGMDGDGTDDEDGAMPSEGMGEAGGDEPVEVLVEFERSADSDERAVAETFGMAERLDVPEFQVDRGYDPVVTRERNDSEAAGAGRYTVTVLGTVPERDIPRLKSQDGVRSVWRNSAAIGPFEAGDSREEAAGESRGGAAGESREEATGEPQEGAAGEPQESAAGEPREGAAGERREGAVVESADSGGGVEAAAGVTAPVVGRENATLGMEAVRPEAAAGRCPVPPCDCDPGDPKGDLAAVAEDLGVTDLWAEGYRGDGMVVGVVDGGITATDRTEDGKVPQVVDGWPEEDWGTRAYWDEHGNMCATDVLGMAPDAELYDLRVASGGGGTRTYLDRLLRAVDWAVQRHREDGTPHVLTLSNGIYQRSWDPEYATNPDHVVTRKIVEAIDEGIVVLFAAGNCGAGCRSTDPRCGDDVGPGESIWGPNGHRRVVTVGAVNVNEEFVGYSSAGPAALAEEKPDVCGVTHFTGYFHSDSGTSAATPVVAGAAALLKQARPSLGPGEVKSLLRETAEDLGEPGHDNYTGSGVVRPKAAHDELAEPAWGDWETVGGTCLDGVAAVAPAAGRLEAFAVGTDGALYGVRRDGAEWSRWEALGGHCISGPAAAVGGDGRLHVFAIGTDNRLYERRRTDGDWQEWTAVGGVCTRGVAAAAGGDAVDVFTVGTDNHLYQRRRADGSWGRWTDLGGPCLSPPAAVARGDRRDVVVIGPDNGVYRRRHEAGTWRRWTSLGGTCTRGVAATGAGDRLDVFAVGTDNGLHHRLADEDGDWEGLGGTAVLPPAATGRGGPNLDAFAVSTDSTLYHRGFGGE